MINGTGMGSGRLLALGVPWTNWRMARKLGLNFLQTLALFEEARRENEARDWPLHLVALLVVLAFVAMGFAIPSVGFAQFSAPAGFGILAGFLFLRACHHHANLLARYEQRKSWMRG